MAREKGRIIGMDREKFRMFMGKYGIGVILLIMMIFISVMEPSFRSTSNMINVATQVSINAMIAYGMCLAITTEGIDLSVGAQLALVSCVLGQLISGKGWNIAAAIIVALLVSTVWGFINGFLISKFNMFPFVVTLSTQLIIRGLAQVISGGQAIPITDTAFKSIYSAKIGPVPFPILVLILATLLMYMILHWTKFGRYVFAVGDNMQAAIASGVSIIKTKTAVYAISGLLAGIAGIIFTAKTASAQSNIGIGYETDAVAACVLGGTSFAGGVATVPGVLMGIFIIGFIYNGMNLIGIDSYYQSMTKGAVIIGAVLLDMVMNKKNN
ncbi:ABC transporter permease [Dorea sp. D27]|uniref:ABC transporter permease n=1 Tax=Dorea sp. D27 TaxID=658665 RepID=UPI000673AB60|nr:ABC transporter permease [Dorea sp. D27]KMZ54267.1 ribose ABC transporter, permease protein [Dorea sp. D27]